MEEGYSICLNMWALDKDIQNELALLLIISSLCAEKGYCYANNEYLAKVFDTNCSLISRKIKKLEEKGYINISYEKRGCEIVSREIRLSNLETDDFQNRKPTISKIGKENNINIKNNKKDNNINIIIEKRFIKPSIQQITEYCVERKNSVDPEAFFDFYESKNWMIGKNKMKDWKAAIRTWEKNSKKKDNVPEWFNQDLNKKEEDEYDELAKQYTRGYLDT